MLSAWSILSYISSAIFQSFKAIFQSFSSVLSYLSPTIKIINFLDVHKTPKFKKYTLKFYILSTQHKYIKLPNIFSSQSHSLRKNSSPLTTEDYTCANCYSSLLCISACNKVDTSNRLLSHKMNLSLSNLQLYNYLNFK